MRSAIAISYFLSALTAPVALAGGGAEFIGKWSGTGIETFHNQVADCVFALEIFPYSENYSDLILIQKSTTCTPRDAAAAPFSLPYLLAEQFSIIEGEVIGFGGGNVIGTYSNGRLRCNDNGTSFKLTVVDGKLHISASFLSGYGDTISAVLSR